MVKMQKGGQTSMANKISLENLGISDTQKREISDQGFSQSIRVLLQNWRQGTVACKGRADVTSRSNKKPWKQKGTGRARAGSPRSPLWRGGGVTFGPQPRVRNLKITKDIKKAIFNNLLFDFVAQEKIIALQGVLSGEKPSTTHMYKHLQAAHLHDRNVVVFLAPEDKLLYLSCVNMPNVKVLFFDQANAFDLSRADAWVFFDKDMAQFKDMVQRWM